MGRQNGVARPDPPPLLGFGFRVKGVWGFFRPVSQAFAGKRADKTMAEVQILFGLLRAGLRVIQKEGFFFPPVSHKEGLGFRVSGVGFRVRNKASGLVVLKFCYFFLSHFHTLSVLLFISEPKDETNLVPCASIARFKCPFLTPCSSRPKPPSSVRS